MTELEIRGFGQPRCMYCHQIIPIKRIKNSNGSGITPDPDDVCLQSDLHLAESPGCAALYRVMCEDDKCGF